MDNSNKIFNDILRKLQESLNEFNCKSEIKITDNEAILYGKFSHYMEKYTVVIHLKEENYKPISNGAGNVKIKDSDENKFVMPSLEGQFSQTQKANCSQEEQIAIRNKFIDDADEIGREFMRKLNK